MDIAHKADQLIAGMMEAKKPLTAADGKVYQPDEYGRFKDSEGTWYATGQEGGAVPVKNFAGTPHQEDKAGRYVAELLLILRKMQEENKKEVERTKNLNLKVAPDKLRSAVVKALKKLPPSDLHFLSSCYRDGKGTDKVRVVANAILRTAEQKLQRS